MTQAQKVMSKRRRGVSEIIASLMLILIVGILGTVLYSYTLSTTLSKYNAIQDETRRHTEIVQEHFRILTAWWSGSGNEITLTVLNYGELDAKIVDIYVDGERSTFFTDTGDVEILTSTWKRVTFESPNPISSDTAYEIILVSERGVSYVYIYKT